MGASDRSGFENRAERGLKGNRTQFKYHQNPNQYTLTYFLKPQKTFNVFLCPAAAKKTILRSAVQRNVYKGLHLTNSMPEEQTAPKEEAPAEEQEEAETELDKRAKEMEETGK